MNFPKWQDSLQNNESVIEEHTTKYQKEIDAIHREKMSKIEFCQRIMVEAERRAEKQSIALIETYQKEERMAYKAIEKAQAAQ